MERSFHRRHWRWRVRRKYKNPAWRRDGRLQQMNRLAAPFPPRQTRTGLAPSYKAEHRENAAMAKNQSLWNAQIVRPAIIDSFRKLDPRVMIKNPVMFVVEVGSVVTSVLLIQELIEH